MIILWIAIFIASLFFLIKSADYFTAYSEKIGLVFGMSSFIIGATIVAVGTSLPELVSSVFITKAFPKDLLFEKMLCILEKKKLWIKKKMTNNRRYVCSCGCGAIRDLGSVFIGKGFGYEVTIMLEDDNLVVSEDRYYSGEVILNLPDKSIHYTLECAKEQSEISNGLFVGTAEGQENERYLVYAVNRRKEVNPHMNEPHLLFLVPEEKYGDYVISGGTISGISLDF